MTTTKSYSNDSRFSAMYKSALKNQMPFIIISGIIFFILIIIVFYASTVDAYTPNYTYKGYTGAQAFYMEYFQQGIYADYSQSVTALVFLAILAVCSALVGLSYMHNRKTVDLYHSLPVTRPQLLTANILASMTAVLAPFLTIYLGTMMIQLIGLGHYGCFGPQYFLFIIFDLACAIVYTAVIYAFVALMAVNVGTVFDAFATTMIIAWTPLLVYAVSGAIWSSMTYGSVFDPGAEMMLLSPFTFIFHNTYFVQNTDKMAYMGTALVIFGGLVAAAVLYILAIVCYRRRKSEIAEQTQPMGVLQIIVKAAVAFAGAAGFYAIFSGSFFVVQLIAVMAGALIIGLVAELILSRGIRLLKRNIKILLIAGVVYCAAIAFVKFDFFGYAMRVPQADSVASVTISYEGRFGQLSNKPNFKENVKFERSLTLPESIAIVTDSHQTATKNPPPEYKYRTNQSSNSDQYGYNNLLIEYKLKNGTTLKRRYNEIYNQAFIRLADLEDKDDFIKANSTVFQMDHVPGGQGGLVASFELCGNIADIAGENTLTETISDMQPLVDALKADLLAESLEGIQRPEAPALGFLRLRYDNTYYVNGKLDEKSYYYNSPQESFVITQEYKNTIAVLNQLGLAGELESPDTGKVERLEIIRASDRYGRYGMTDNCVRVMLPFDQKDRGKYDPAQESLASSSDAADIKAVADASLSQFLIKYDEQPETFVIVFFVFENGNYCEKMIRLADLPSGLRGKVEAGMLKS